jgi:hypothetical protein
MALSLFTLNAAEAPVGMTRDVLVAGASCRRDAGIATQRSKKCRYMETRVLQTFEPLHEILGCQPQLALSLVWPRAPAPFWTISSVTLVSGRSSTLTPKQVPGAASIRSPGNRHKRNRRPLARQDSGQCPARRALRGRPPTPATYAPMCGSRAALVNPVTVSAAVVVSRHAASTGTRKFMEAGRARVPVASVDCARWRGCESGE